MKQVTAPNEAIAQVFAERKAEQKPVYMPFVMGGYPTYDDSIDIALTMQEAGAHVLEVGFPYSDPLADGPTIQEASKVALEAGMSLTKGLRLIEDMRKAGVTIPIVAFCYYNPILQHGISSFIEHAKRAGANGMIVPDLPHEESADVREIAKAEQFAYVSLVAPNSRQRIRQIASEAEGFIYCISSLGVTGARDSFSDELDAYLDDVRAHSTVPLAIGFGISKKEHVQFFAKKADGIIIASAIIDYIGQHLHQFEQSSSKKDVLHSLKKFVQELFSE